MSHENTASGDGACPLCATALGGVCGKRGQAPWPQRFLLCHVGATEPVPFSRRGMGTWFCQSGPLERENGALPGRVLSAPTCAKHALDSRLDLHDPAARLEVAGLADARLPATVIYTSTWRAKSWQAMHTKPLPRG